MKTREYEVYVIVDDNGEPKRLLDWTNNNNKPAPWIKAKLIIEVPEKPVSITESQLRDCFDSFRRLENDHDRTLVYSFYEFAKQKLFGDGEK